MYLSRARLEDIIHGTNLAWLRLVDDSMDQDPWKLEKDESIRGIAGQRASKCDRSKEVNYVGEGVKDDTRSYKLE